MPLRFRLIYMEITLLTIGKTKTRYIIEGINEYSKRLKHYIPFSIEELPDIKTTRSLTEDMQKVKEGEMMLSKISTADYLVLLDERGTEYKSLEFASYLEKLMASGRRRVVFAVGGPYGFAPDLYSRADAKISLSKMTFNHEMVRLFFTEQIYRGMTILRGEPYHHE